jgi:hypothetical protein
MDSGGNPGCRAQRREPNPTVSHRIRRTSFFHYTSAGKR